jgi:hypothetical protein
MPGAASLVWSCVDTFLQESCAAADQVLGENREGLDFVQEDADSGEFDIRTARARVSTAEAISYVAKWDRLALLCARVPTLLHNGTVRSVRGVIRKIVTE